MDLTEYNEIMDMISLYGKYKDSAGYFWGNTKGDDYIKANGNANDVFGKICLKVADLVRRYEEAKEDLKYTLDKQN